MKLILSGALLALLSLPALAAAPAGSSAALPGSKAANTGSATSTSTPAPDAAAVLGTLAGKPQIVGLTKTNGARFLGRVISGDHGMYVVQTFHFAGPSQFTTQPTTQTTGSGKNRRVIRGTKRIETKTFIPDDAAVQLLVRTGSTGRPQEMPAGQEMVPAADVKYLQALSPPAPGKTGPWTMTTLWPIGKNTIRPAGPPLPK